MTLCPKDCPERCLHCHRTCQRYNRARITQQLTSARHSRKLTDEADFYRCLKQKLNRRNRSHKYGDKD